jgi:O6-methylguanine-DNA--protein-cysteine methyltransferase
MRSNYNRDIPCHRVVKSDGSLGSYNRGGEKRKREILVEEGAL